MRGFLRSPTVALIAMALIATLIRCAYAAERSRISPYAGSLAGFCWAWPVLIWIDYDAGRRRKRPCFDFGLFLVMTFPVSIAWYCFWSRGWRGIKLLLGLGSLLFLPIFAATFLEEVLR